MDFTKLLSFDSISSLNLSKFKHISLCDDFYKNPGNEHYKLLAYISTLFNNINIIEIGTHVGESAIALSYNENNTVYKFDIINKISEDKKSQNNINYIIDDIMRNDESRNKWKDIILSSAFIFLDVDPHNGIMEYDFYLFLKENNYNGFVICDNIWYFKEMRDNFWYKIEDKFKFDISNLGHWSGTGIFTFNENIHFQKYDNSNWTLFTSYFNLTKCPDASEEICKRDSSYYFSHSISTLSLPYNLIIYCDSESYEQIYNLRPEYLREKTKYFIIEFDDIKIKDNIVYNNLTFLKCRDIINNNRALKPYYFDNRNTASYYLFCLSRYILMKDIIKENPFNSSHFCWINFCIERMGYNNLKYLDEALALNRDKFSTCYIDYIPPELVNNTHEYYKWGRCSMCSGFFTGNKDYMYKVCDLIEEKFLYYLSLGYGHADEQLYSPVYFENKDFFEHYYGDYQQMITNYKYTYESPEAPIRNFITNSFKFNNYKKCIEGCEFLLNSIELNKCNISPDNLNYLFDKYVKAKILTKYYFGNYKNELDYSYKLIKELLNSGNNKDCFTYCEIILNYINENKLSVNLETLFLIYFSYYISSYYVNYAKSLEIVDSIFEKCKNNLEFKNAYLSNKEFYDNQFNFVNHKNKLQPIFPNIPEMPIIIICYNNYKYVDNTIKLLEKVNDEYLENVIILDNNSSCVDTKRYLKESKHKIIFNDKNYGPWIDEYVNSYLYNNLPDKFIITDPDLEFNKNLPKKFIEIMKTLSDKYLCNKIGFALKISDYNEMYQTIYAENKTIYEQEIQFYNKRINDDDYELYDASIDTTFCMINKKGTNNPIRIAGNFTAKHIPWYIKNTIYNDYELYTIYSNTDYNISTISKTIVPYIEKKYIKIKKNQELFLIENNENNNNINFWKDTYLNWENDTFSILDKYLKKDKIFIDIGGWIGTTAMYGSRKSKHIYCVQADSKSFVDLKRNIETNCEKNYTLINNAIYNINDIYIEFGKNLFLKDSKMNDSTSQIYSVDNYVSNEYELIKTITLNHIINTYNINCNEISLIKVDIEGGEENILSELIDIYKIYNVPIYISFHYDWWKNKDLDRFEFLSENHKNLIRCDPFTSILFSNY
jgi:FkbM family methyltransferase